MISRNNSNREHHTYRNAKAIFVITIFENRSNITKTFRSDKIGTQQYQLSIDHRETRDGVSVLERDRYKNDQKHT